MNVLEMVSAINPIAFEIGGLQMRWYGIIIAFTIYLATTLADKATRKGYRKEFIIDLSILGSATWLCRSSLVLHSI